MKRPQFSSATAGILAIFVLALGLRLLGLTWGLPNAARWYSYHPDESPHQLVGAVYSVVINGDWNPHFFNYPSLVVYLTSFVYMVAGGLGMIAPSTPWQLTHDIIVCGRVVSAVLGAATVVPVYGLGRALLKDRDGKVLGGFAALLLAILPGHVQHSHFATVDVPATFFVAVCLWASVRACEAASPLRWVLWAALVAGLATATKYNAVLVLIAPLCAIWLRRHDISWAVTSLLTLGLAALGFLLGCPYAVLSFNEFWGKGDQGFAYELLRHPHEGSGEIFVHTGNGWVYHLLVNAPYLLTWPLLVASLLGVAFSLWEVVSLLRRKLTDDVSDLKTPTALVLLCFALLYFASLGFSQVRFMRYLLPLCPVWCVLGVWGMARVCSVLPSFFQFWRMGSIIALLGCVFSGLASTLGAFMRPDPRDQAAQFMTRTAPQQGVRVGLVGAPWFWTPPLQPRGDNVKIGASADGHYQFAYTGFDVAQLQSKQPTYFVISEYEWMEKKRLGDPTYLAFMKALNRDYGVVGDFKNPRPAQPGASPYVPHDYLYNNPEIVIYQRKNG